jgi:hypothetical protein
VGAGARPVWNGVYADAQTKRLRIFVRDMSWSGSRRRRSNDGIFNRERRQIMTDTRVLLTIVVIAGVVALAPVHAQSGRGAGSELTAQDRTEIQGLVTHYARALGSCAAEEYADLFAPGGGYFFSSIRGEVATRERLIQMVQSERHCNPAANAASGNPNSAARANAPSANANGAGRDATGPVVTIESSSGGARGTASLGNAGSYEDEYVKTAKGWRFKARSVITPAEAAAKLTAQDFSEIRQLAGNDRGQFDDVWVDTPNGRRFRSSGVALGLLPEGVKGTAYLRNDGGHYDDVYVKSANGWRFKSRTYVPAEAKSPQ